jgi:hypothetical protein
MEFLSPMDLIISGCECQGFSMVGFGESLNDRRSDLFTDMVRLITWAQSISPTLGYVIDNTLSQLDQRENVATPLWPSVGVKPNTSKVGDLESSGTPECLELDSKAQNTSH